MILITLLKSEVRRPEILRLNPEISLWGCQVEGLAPKDFMVDELLRTPEQGTLR